ncbi:MAG: hypothetical protein NVS9B15_15470 [Acidobacteriaceae bacterium]
MSLLELLREEEIAEEHLQQYFRDLYRVVCVSERVPQSPGCASVVRCTYIMDWEQLVHFLEDYEGLTEDVVEVARVADADADAWKVSPFGPTTLGRA